jgi:hypothetical protein
MSVMIRLNDVPIALFPLLITIVVTCMSGMFGLYGRVLTQRAILTFVAYPSVWRISTITRWGDKLLGARARRRYKRAVSLL